MEAILQKKKVTDDENIATSGCYDETITTKAYPIVDINHEEKIRRKELDNIQRAEQMEKKLRMQRHTEEELFKFLNDDANFK